MVLIRRLSVLKRFGLNPGPNRTKNVDGYRSSESAESRKSQPRRGQEEKTAHQDAQEKEEGFYRYIFFLKFPKVGYC